MIGVAVVGGLVYVTDSPASRVVVFTDAGDYAGEWSATGDGPLTSPGAIAAGGGHIYVMDGQSRIQEFTAVGAFVAAWGSSGSGPGQFSTPYGIGAGPHGEIYVADTFNHRIQVFGTGAVPARSRTWGSLKALYR